MVEVNSLGLSQTVTAAIIQQPVYEIVVVIGKAGKVLVISPDCEDFISVYGHQEWYFGV
jgi:hypothetical protein